MKYTIDRNGEHLTVCVSGKLDATTASDLENGMKDELAGITDITFDLANLEYISSAGLRIVFASYKLMAKRDGALRVVNATGGVLDVFKASGFASLYGIE